MKDTISENDYSPAHALVKGGIAVFSSLSELDDFKTPYKLTMNLLAVVVKGEISATIDVSHREMSGGSIMVLRPGHIVNAISQSADFEGFFILIKEDRFLQMVPIASSAVVSCLLHFSENPIVSGVKTAEISNLELIYNLLGSKSHTMNMPYNEQAFNALCDLLFYETIGIYTVQMMHNGKQKSGNKNQRVGARRREDVLSRFMKLVDLYFKKEHSVRYYADALNISAKHLSSVVKQTTGMPASEWVSRKVIREAQYLLRCTPKTIQQISTELNFPNQSFFGKFFKLKVGLTPREYRSGINE